MEIMNEMIRSKFMPLILGIIIGVILSIAIDQIYVDIFHENGSKFYLFASLALMGGPLVGGLISALTTKENRSKALLISGLTVFVVIFILSILSYVVLPVFSYDGVPIPASCIDNASGGSHLPSYLNYTIPGIGNGTLITSDGRSAVVAMTDYDHLPFKSTIYLINKSNSEIIQSLSFDNDIIAAVIDDGTLYIYNDKILYTINTGNGEFVKDIFKIDNYRGVYTRNHDMYMQTNLEISALGTDGSVLSHGQWNLTCIAYGCLISRGN